ncbi:MAG: outer membrane lipoprotein-sorting protein [Spirochaeta sp.]
MKNMAGCIHAVSHRALMAAAVVMLGAGLGSAQLSAQEQYTGDEVLQRMETTLFPETYRMRMRMVTTEPSGREKELELSTQYRRGTGTYMEIESPPRSRGTRFLQRDEALWMYIPRGRSRSAIRLSGRDSFQGSVFANRDIGESMYTEDYQAEVVGRETIEHEELGEVEVYRIEMSPRHDEAAYGKIDAWVTLQSFIPVRMQYYVRAGMNIKELRMSDIQRIAGRERPLRMEMRSFEEEGKVSVVSILELEDEDNLPDRIFTQQYLTR